MTRTAQEWAGHLHDTNTFEHRPNNIYGENLFALGSRTRFTAMVWKSSTRVGVGLKQGKNGTYVVVNFAEQGNVLNHFVANVLPPVSADRQSR